MHPNSRPRRRRSQEPNAKVLAACDEAGASISGVALAHGLNANLVRKWRAGLGTKRDSMAITLATSAASAPAASDVAAEFVAVEMPAPSKAATRAAVEPREPAPFAKPLIHVELRRGPLHLNMRWPTAAAEDLVAGTELGPAEALGGRKTFVYVYDSGDNWRHKVKIEKVVALDTPIERGVCIGGENACTPEAVGGAPGHEEFLEAQRDPSHPEHGHLKAWIGGAFDPQAFDVAETNARLTPSEY